MAKSKQPDPTYERFKQSLAILERLSVKTDEKETVKKDNSTEEERLKTFEKSLAILESWKKKE